MSQHPSQAVSVALECVSHQSDFQTDYWKGQHSWTEHCVVTALDLERPVLQATYTLERRCPNCGADVKLAIDSVRRQKRRHLFNRIGIFVSVALLALPGVFVWHFQMYGLLVAYFFCWIPLLYLIDARKKPEFEVGVRIVKETSGQHRLRTAMPEQSTFNNLPKFG